MRIHVPAALRQWSGGQEIVEIALQPSATATLADVFATLSRDYPGIHQRVLDDQGSLRRHVNLFLDGEDVRFLNGLATRVRDDSEMWIAPALSGGSVASNCRGPG